MMAKTHASRKKIHQAVVLNYSTARSCRQQRRRTACGAMVRTHKLTKITEKITCKACISMAVLERMTR